MLRVLSVLQPGNRGLGGADLPGELRPGHVSVFRHFPGQHGQVNLVQGPGKGFPVRRGASAARRLRYVGYVSWTQFLEESLSCAAHGQTSHPDSLFLDHDDATLLDGPCDGLEIGEQDFQLNCGPLGSASKKDSEGLVSSPKARRLAKSVSAEMRARSSLAALAKTSKSVAACMP